MFGDQSIIKIQYSPRGEKLTPRYLPKRLGHEVIPRYPGVCSPVRTSVWGEAVGGANNRTGLSRKSDFLTFYMSLQSCENGRWTSFDAKETQSVGFPMAWSHFRLAPETATFVPVDRKSMVQPVQPPRTYINSMVRIFNLLNYTKLTILFTKWYTKLYTKVAVCYGLVLY